MMEEVKVISKPSNPMQMNLQGNALNEEASPLADEVTRTNSQQMLLEAKAEGQLLIENAEQMARKLETAAAEKIKQWWEENEKKLADMTLEAKQQGFMEGMELGKQEAKVQCQQEYQEKFEQIQQLLEQAYLQKETIIAEAEPFLLELSTVIATQIVKQELESDPDKFVELIKQHILRFKEKEFITVCVHPDDFNFIESQRAHLVAVVNGETEIKVIPDHTVTPKGCIIRTAYGSVDARIDTQIEEIKKVILEVRREPERATIS